MEKSEIDSIPFLMPQGTVELHITDIRFAHDSLRELFGHLHTEKCTEMERSVLQLAVELLAGITLATEVPAFRICRHGGDFYCHSGNRRLAAFHLAHRFAPERFGRLALPYVSTDQEFLHGTEKFQRKLTTSRNGSHCQGRWLVFKETGEAVGHVLPGHRVYGSDLLSLLTTAVQ